MKRGLIWNRREPASIEGGKKRRRPHPVGPAPAACYAVVFIRVPIEPEVALVCSHSPGLLPS